MNIRESIEQEVLVFDGAFGTYYTEKYPEEKLPCETANINHPERVLAIHREYLEAGCRALKTNTFGAYPENLGKADQEAVIKEGYRLAQEAAAGKAYVFADLGPAPGNDAPERAEAFCQAAEIFIRCGAQNFLMETNCSNEGIPEALQFIRERVPDAFILVSYAAFPDGYTREGFYFKKLMTEIRDTGLCDVVGLNCVCGSRHMGELLGRLGGTDMKLFAMPNAGYPTMRGNRTFYDGNAEYFAAQTADFVSSGVRIIGGCCGTTPKHMELVVGRLSGQRVPKLLRQPAHGTAKEPAVRAENPFFEKISQGKKVIAVELDSPKDTNLEKFMGCARDLKEAGADAMTIADCPIAQARMDSTLLACKVKRELNLDVLPHMTCRDRNINAAKALLLAAHAEQIRNVLVITGDPIPTAQREEIPSVFQFNSVKMAAYLQSLNEELFEDPFRVFGALNINAVNFDSELKRAKKKEEAGMVGFLTQPVLSEEAKENLIRAHEELSGKILGGIIPVVSERNARFMESEVNGIHVSEEIIARYVGKDREEAENLACEISCRIAGEIAPYVDGYYLMTPFQRTKLMRRIISGISHLC